MTREEVLEKYKKDKNLSEAILYKVNLHKVNLYKANLEGAYLHKANLERINLVEANLKEANLKESNLKEANLQEANLERINLVEANLYGANLYGVNLYGANLHKANLEGAILYKANLYGANLEKAKNIPSIFRTSLNILKYQPGKLRAYKYLDNTFESPYRKFKYEIGKAYETYGYNDDERYSCGSGYNVATLDWCLRDTEKDLSKIYIEVEFTAKDIVAIPYNSSGKFRVKKMKILRKLSIDELENALKDLYIES